jgi:peptidoglycan/LPS O-acetylase OafA/YrhL
LTLIDLRDYPRLSQLVASSLAPLFCLELAFAFLVNTRERWYYELSPLLGAIPGILCVAGLQQPNRTFMHRVYEHPIPVYFGRICYGLYLYHFPIFIWIQSWAPKDHVPLTTLLIGWPVAILVASASYFLIERHFMRARPV